MYWQYYSTPLLLPLLLLQAPYQRKFHRKIPNTHWNVYVYIMCTLVLQRFRWLDLYVELRAKRKKEVKKHVLTSKRIDRFSCEYDSCCLEFDVQCSLHTLILIQLTTEYSYTFVYSISLCVKGNGFCCVPPFQLQCIEYTEHFFLFLFIFISHHQTWNDYQSNLSMPLKGNGTRTHAGKTGRKNDLRRKKYHIYFGFVLFLSPYTLPCIDYFGIRKLNERIVAKKATLSLNVFLLRDFSFGGLFFTDSICITTANDRQCW